RRADARGASRLALFVIAGYALTLLVAGHHVADVNLEISSVLKTFGPVLVWAAMLWIIYVALEPYVRRFWPDGILGWTRLLSGYVRDPRVGRDVLIGCVIAVFLSLNDAISYLLPPLVGRAPAIPLFQPRVGTLAGTAALSATLVYVIVGGL